MAKKLCVVALIFFTIERKALGAVQTSSTLSTNPTAGQAAVSPAVAENPGNTNVNLTLNVEGVTVELDNLTVSLSGLRVGIKKLTLIAEVNLPPLLPQLGDVVGGVGKAVGPATQALSSSIGPITKSLSDTTGKVTGSGEL